MIPGEIITQPGDITLNEGREAITLMVANTGDRPVQVALVPYSGARIVTGFNQQVMGGLD